MAQKITGLGTFSTKNNRFLMHWERHLIIFITYNSRIMFVTGLIIFQLSIVVTNQPMMASPTLGCATALITSNMVK